MWQLSLTLFEVELNRNNDDNKEKKPHDSTDLKYAISWSF